MSETIHQERLEYGSKYIDIKVNNEGIAIVTIRTANIENKTKGETTELYGQISTQLQKLANERNQQIEQRFSTRNEKMKKWMQTTGIEMGFINLEDDGRILRAIKNFYPNE